MDQDRADNDDGWLEQALKSDAQAAGYIADDGFTSAVMARLPAPATLPAWRRPAVALLWLVAAGALAALLPGLFYTVFGSLVTLFVQPLTWSHIGVLLLAIGATTWSTLVYAMRAE